MQAHRNFIQYTELPFNDFPKSFGRVSIFFISDIHKRKISAKMLDSVKGKVDLVIIGGDLLEKGVPLKKVIENIKRLKEVGLVYFVWGNNDYEVDYHELDSILIGLGVKILDNTAVSFESESGDQLSLLGVDDISNKRDRLHLALQDSQKDSFKILVSHNPQIVEKISVEHEIKLVLSGHTHGGQIRLGNLGFYKKGGLFHTNVTKLFISNGYGTTMIPFRLGAPAETHVITIHNPNL